MSPAGPDSFTPPGTPSDASAEIRATGTSDVGIVFTSMTARHADGADADYLRWHALDHCPEQFRLPGIRSSLRAVSTPQCRAVRAANDPSLDATDHVMTYFFTGIADLKGFGELGGALSRAGRMTCTLPPVQRAAALVLDRMAAPRIRVGADVLPWWPARGLYLLIEEEGAPALDGVTEVPGVAGLWRTATTVAPFADTAPGQQISYLFLDDDPVQVGERLRPSLTRRWESSRARPLLAAPFHTVVPHEWGRYLP